MSLKVRIEKMKLATVVLGSLPFLLALFMLVVPCAAQGAQDNTLKLFFDPARPTDHYGYFEACISDLYPPNGITPSYQVDWYRNGVFQDNLSRVIYAKADSYNPGRFYCYSDVTRDYIRRGDTWRCVVTPLDGRPAVQAETVIVSRPPYFVGYLPYYEREAPDGTPIYQAFRGKLFNFDVRAEDHDKDRLIYTDPVLPEGASISQDRVFSWLPSKSNPAGDYPLEFKVSDGETEVVRKIIINIDVSGPIVFEGLIRPDADGTLRSQGRAFFNAFPGTPFSILVSAYNPSGDELTYTYPPLPAGAVIDPATRILTWTPSRSDAGKTYNLEFRASDGSSVATATAIISVLQPMPAVDLSGYMPPVGNQGGIGSCSSWAAGYYYKSFQEAREHNWDTTLPEHQCSPSFLFNQFIEGDSPERKIVYPNNFDFLDIQGCASLKDMPYTEDVSIYPNSRQYVAAMPFRSQGHSYWASNVHQVNGMRNHLANGDALNIVVFDLFADLSDSGGNDVYDGYRPPGYLPSNGHALAIVGYDDNREYTSADGIRRKGAFKFVNSWGSNWSGDGYSWISYDYIDNCVGEIVTMTDRIGYQPKAIAQFHSTHPRRSDLEVNLCRYAAGSTSLFMPLFSHKGGAQPDIDAAFDISDAVDAGYLPPSAQNKWLLNVQDTIPGESGVIDAFKIKYRANINDKFSEFVATDVPVAIPDATNTAVSSIVPEEINNHPVFDKLENPINITLWEGKRFLVTVTDSDNDRLEFVRTMLPPGANFWVISSHPGAISAIFDWDPESLDQVNTYRVGFQVSDGKATVGTSIIIKVQAQPLSYFLTTSAANGSVTKSPDLPNYTSNAMVKLTAKPNTGYKFVGWGQDLTGSTSSVTITMSSNKKVTASFAVINTPPEFKPPLQNIVGVVDGLISFPVSATDKDNDKLEFIRTLLPTGATLTVTDSRAGALKATFNWTPTSAQVNTYRVGFQVTDGKATTGTSIDITVKAKTPAPSPNPKPNPSPSASPSARR